MPRMLGEFVIGIPNNVTRINDRDLFPVSVVSSINQPILTDQAPVH